jgi:pimeloyl-ACP methyl ester carboxylesterase
MQHLKNEEADMKERLVVEVPGGRRLDVFVDGDATARPIVLHHGTPGSGLSLPVIDAAFRRHGLRSISISRPGFGSSTRQLGRRVSDIAADTVAVLDRLGDGRCLIAGFSGGAPHALACGALAPDRVDAVLVIAGCAPYPTEGLDWTAGMSDDDAAEARAAIAGDDAIRAMVAPRASWYRTATGADLMAIVGGRLPDADVAALSANAEDFVANFREGLRSGIDGWIDDWHAFVHPWGFDLRAITVPTMFWHGELDTMSPLAHATWLVTHIPGSVLHIEPGEAHISLCVNAFDRMLEALVRTAP